MTNKSAKPIVGKDWLRKEDGILYRVIEISNRNAVFDGEPANVHCTAWGSKDRIISIAFESFTEESWMEKMIEVPELASVWRNKKSGELYGVYDYTNQKTERPDDYPVRISYMRLSDMTSWSRALTDWHRSYEPAAQEEVANEN